MKKPIVIVLVLIVLGLIVWSFSGKKVDTKDSNTNTDPTVSAPISETTKVSDKLSSYKNEELGFSIKYPSTWDIGTSDAAVLFVIPPGKSANSLKKLESKISFISGKCSFPPVTTIKERSTLKSGDLSFNMISMSNTVQGNNYFDRMYSLQREGICYIFSFSSITASPASQKVKGSEATVMTNNNKAIVESADAQFIEMVKSFAYVVGPKGQDEASVVPIKK